MKNTIHWLGNLENDCDKAILLRNGEVVAVQYSNNANIIAFPNSKDENGESIGIDFPANTDTKAPELNFSGKGNLTLNDFFVYHIEAFAVLKVFNGWWPVLDNKLIVYNEDNKRKPDTWPENFPTGTDLTVLYCKEAKVVAVQQQNYDSVSYTHLTLPTTSRV